MNKDKLFLIFIIFIIPLFCSSCSENTTENEKQGFSDSDKVAVTQVKCHNELKAKFVNPVIKDRMDYSIENNSIVVYGSIEHQNLYGGLIRQNWACECIIDEDADTIKLNDLNIE